MEYIKFTTGTLKITEDSINMKFLEGSKSMFRHQIGKVNISKVKRYDKNEMVYGFRFGIVGAILWLAGIFMAKALIGYLGLAGLVIGFIMVFGFMFIDGILGIPFIRPLLLTLFGYECLQVSIQNTSGDNIEFETVLTDRSKAKGIEKLRLDKSINPTVEVDKKASNSSLEIEQLHELMTKEIITKEEFETKKKQLLGL